MYRKKVEESNQGLARKEFNRVVSVLEKNGYNKDPMTLFDFWEKNKTQLHSKIYDKSVADDTFELQVRWYSSQKLEEAKIIRKYIQKKVNDNNKVANEQQKVVKVTIDFSDINPPVSSCTISKFVNGDLKKYELVDLRGINLIDMHVSGCNFKNCCFNDAFFDFSEFINVSFIDSTFSRTSFYKSELIAVDMHGISAWAGAYVDGAYLSQISDFNENTLPYPFVTSDITYLQLVGQLINKIRYSDSKFKDEFLKQGFTVYSDVSVEGLKKLEVKELKEHITWFQSWNQRLLNFKTLKPGRKIEFSIALLFTKYWSSALTFAGVILFVDFIFSCIFFFCSSSFNHLTIPNNHIATFIKSFYYSTVTLLTLGYGDVFPLYWGGQIIVTVEVLLGYVFLGLFIYLISRRVERLY